LALAGYFNDRPNRGVLDQLYVRAALFADGKTTCGLVSFDLVFVTGPMVEAIRKRLRRERISFGDNLVFCATHIHTGPYTSTFATGSADKSYLKLVAAKAALAVMQAAANLHPAALACGAVKRNPYAFNRRYWMRDGRVVTNPGRRNPEIVRPEGPVDREILILAVRQEERIAGLLVNIVNHTDTIGLDLVSADWPGQMEKEIQRRLGYETPVVTLIGASGNINHFDVRARGRQTSYREAKRIGRGYARIVLEALGKLGTIRDTSLSIGRAKVKMACRTVSPEQIRKAKEIVKTAAAAKSGDLTSEHLARGDAAAQHYFADQLLRFHKAYAGRERELELISLRFGKELAIASLPGEPFTEIGLRIKARSPFKQTLVVGLAQAACGYIPLKECFARGGYEQLPALVGGLQEDAADLLVRHCVATLHNRVRNCVQKGGKQ
jgi:hypothetical protein